jgi:hypothetical protein
LSDLAGLWRLPGIRSLKEELSLLFIPRKMTMQKQTDGIKIIHTSSLQEAERLTKEGWEPIECSIDGQSVVGRLQMDHHGKLSGLEGVAVRAYRDHFGACSEGKSQGFIVTGVPDEDQTFAIAALSGMLPHPSRAAELAEKPWLGEWIKGDLTELGELINRIDTDPIRYIEELPLSHNGQLLLAWGGMRSRWNDRTSLHAGVDRWRHLTSPWAPAHMIKAAAAEEASRLEQALHPTRISSMGKVTLVECNVYGLDVWYKHHSPCVVHLKVDGEIDVGVKDEETAVRLFGTTGLREVFGELDKITGKGWGGRIAICGGPRGVRRTWDEGVEIALALAKWISEVEHTR